MIASIALVVMNAASALSIQRGIQGAIIHINLLVGFVLAKLCTRWIVAESETISDLRYIYFDIDNDAVQRTYKKSKK